MTARNAQIVPESQLYQYKVTREWRAAVTDEYDNCSCDDDIPDHIYSDFICCVRVESDISEGKLRENAGVFPGTLPPNTTQSIRLFAHILALSHSQYRERHVDGPGPC